MILQYIHFDGDCYLRKEFAANGIYIQKHFSTPPTGRPTPNSSSPNSPGDFVGSKGRQRQLRSMVARAETLAECASNRGVRMMIDAEQTYFQPAIHHLTVHTLMPKYNSKKPIVYNTIQAYLKDSGPALQQDFATSDVMGFSYGMKLVRGAYMESRRGTTPPRRYPDPIFGTKLSLCKTCNKARNSDILIDISIPYECDQY
ncbi:hypothetical protein EMCRGX_G024043 [Ephydatia muelleri]